MSSLPRVSYPGKQAWLGLLISGMWFLVLEILLGLMSFPLGILASVVISQYGDARISLFRKLLIAAPESWVTAGMCGVTFLAAFLSARSRWSYRPALSSFLACATGLAVFLGPAAWNVLRAFVTDASLPIQAKEIYGIFASSYTMLASATLGGRFGARRFNVV